MQYTSRILLTGLHPPLDTRIFKLILVFVRVYCHATLTTYVLSRGKLVLLVGLQSLWRVLLLFRAPLEDRCCVADSHFA